MKQFNGALHQFVTDGFWIAVDEAVATAVQFVQMRGKMFIALSLQILQ